jgi:hypothetical protein
MSNATGTITYTYMAGPPAYAAEISNLPIYMYLRNGTTADDASIWANSYYQPASATTPSGTTGINWINASINWINASINTTSNVRLATGFTPGKSELLPLPQAAIEANPNLTQNPRY